MHAEPTPRAWWREPMLWIVIGGPLSVVVAATVTAVIAWRGADTVVAEPAAAPPMQQPALKARNHLSAHAAAPR
jgi:hypothetical protein